MAVRIANQAADQISDMLADTIKVHFEGSPADTEVGWAAIPSHCTPAAPCAQIAHYLGVLSGDEHINGISRIAKIDLPKEHRPAGSTNGYGKAQPAITATEPQIKFLTSLVAERDILSLVPAHRDLVAKFQANPQSITKAQASTLITELKVTAYSAKVSTNGFQKDRQARVQAADAKRRAELVELEVGIYRVEDTIYKVQKAVHGSGHLYAKVLVVDAPGSAHFEYAAGAIRKIRPEHRMDLEQAKAFGAIYGVCCECSRTLTDEESIAAGIGPICAKKF